MTLRIIIGLAITVIALTIAGRRLWWLYRIGRTGQPAPERVAAVRTHPARDAETEATEVLGQRKLLQWRVPGIAHFVTFWGFIILILTLIESYGDLFSRRFAIPGIGHWAWVGFLEDLMAVAVMAGIITFAVIRFRHDPKREGRNSRFAGSHTGAAWLVLVLIFLVVATLLNTAARRSTPGCSPMPTTHSPRRSSGTGCTRSAWARTRSSRRPSCWPSWRWCSASWCWSPTPSTCTSSPPR